MDKPCVVAGRIIEIHADRVLTQQGDVISTYHPRYYKLPDAEPWILAGYDLKEEPDVQLNDKRKASVPKRRWQIMSPWFSPQKKSANRI
ncbi:hypothetical protein [Paenibacillus sp. MMS20-IR301]|uniref:hypothetical protein n=1 Tax=Paenibacillus sp. MMS20-IR301 TaxID=2895946 RepID=UPI0028E34894|nr:hypothetical protein [Paenibacillus sp. MMS20-IR301]WNS41754.1 hypothetical protein LOS79_22425 [Paenibacillus sp. MMS20-IR301]